MPGIEYFFPVHQNKFYLAGVFTIPAFQSKRPNVAQPFFNFVHNKMEYPIRIL